MRSSLGHRLNSVASRYERAMPECGVRRPQNRVTGCSQRWRFAVLPRGSTTERAVRVGDVLARRSRLEAVLFLSREPLTLRRLAQLANLTDGTEARTLLESQRQRYDERGCAFQVAQLAGGYQLLSRAKFSQWLRPLTGARQEIRLSPPALETLAVVAYRQPIGRAEVEAIRGVGCGEILRQLMERDLLRIVGRSEELGRPLWYGTTRRFLQAFGLAGLEQLPLAAELRRTSMEVQPAVEPSTLYPDHDG